MELFNPHLNKSATYNNVIICEFAVRQIRNPIIRKLITF